jgi:hypothetical protein
MMARMVGVAHASRRMAKSVGDVVACRHGTARRPESRMAVPNAAMAAN